jgi:RNA polymerase sigma factor (sigma-70 family)
MDPSQLPHKLVFGAIHMANRMRGKQSLVLSEDDQQGLATMIVGMYARNYDPAKAKPSTFLTKSARIALRALSTTRQRIAKKPRLIQAVLFTLDKESRSESDHPESCIEDMDRAKTIESVRNALQWLDPTKARIIELKDFENKKIKDIAKIVGVSKTKVSKLRDDGLDELKFFLSQFTMDAFGGDNAE